MANAPAVNSLSWISVFREVGSHGSGNGPDYSVTKAKLRSSDASDPSRPHPLSCAVGKLGTMQRWRLVPLLYSAVLLPH